MKRTLFTIIAGLLFALSVSAAEPAKPAAQGGGTGGTSDLVINALRGLSALLPKPDAPKEEGKVSTIGVRGAESTTTLVSPYWKEDRSNDPAFAAELSAYTAAHNLLQEKRWDEAQQALSKFLVDHPKSDLVPNARFGQAVASAGASKNGEAADQFKQFARDYPKHPLRTDAEKFATALAGR